MPSPQLSPSPSSLQSYRTIAKTLRQSHRRMVARMLYDDPLPYRLVLLDGNTGTAKTALLPLLQARGVQVLDLEGLACHRGSLLGAMPGGQPAQKWFETGLARALLALDPARPVVVEAESSKIGRITLPRSLWQAMLVAPRIVMEVPLAARAAYLADAYREVLSETGRLAERLAPLRRIRGHAAVDHWIALSRAGAFTELATALAVDHYDPAYAKSRKIDTRTMLARVEAPCLDRTGQERAADQIAAHLAAWGETR